MPEPDDAAARALIARWLKQASSGGSPDVYTGKRAAVRLAWDCPIEVCYNDEVHNARIRDISATGVGILCKVRMRPDTVVYLREHESDSWIRCRVKHNTSAIGTNKVGVALVFDIN